MRQRDQPRRIAVIGTSGSGKTTLAAQIARRQQIPHVELDSLHWEPNWAMAATPIFRARVVAALEGPGWVVDGNYSKVRDLIWLRADTIIWLDYPLRLILWRLLRRTLRRVLLREQLWNGNRERLLNQFASRDSLFLWALQSHSRHKREYPALLESPEHTHLQLVRLRSPQERTAGYRDRLYTKVPVHRSQRLAYNQGTTNSSGWGT